MAYVCPISGADAADSHERWACDRGYTLELSIAGDSVTIQNQTGQTYILPLAAVAPYTMTWNNERTSLCETAKTPCAFRAEAEDRPHLLIYPTPNQEPLECRKL